jgi:hypothetical protein
MEKLLFLCFLSAWIYLVAFPDSPDCVHGTLSKTSMACVRQTSKRNFFPVRPLASILPAGRNPENNCLFPKMNWPVEPFSCRHSRCKSERIGRRFRRRRGNLRRFRRRGTHGRNDHDQDWRAVTAGEWLNRPPSDFRGCCTGAADMPPGSTYVHVTLHNLSVVYGWSTYGSILVRHSMHSCWVCLESHRRKSSCRSNGSG